MSVALLCARIGVCHTIYLGDYTHTLILMTIILYFYFYTYTEAELIGGFEGMYQKLQQAAIERPVAGKAGGSY